MARDISKGPDPKIVEAARKITSKRPKTVVDHILKHGFITNEDLKDTYGYNHPPRAIRDVREEGIPLVLYKVEDKTGRKIGAYRFGDPSAISQNKLGGRTTFSKQFKQTLVASSGSRCSLCHERYEDRYLTIDHRVPYEVAGDSAADERQPQGFMLLCGACQRRKSWSCEHCHNWTNEKDESVCARCYWASPEDYSHLAGKPQRRVELVWSDSDVAAFERLVREAKKSQLSLQEWLKQRLQR